ncbi:6-carboxy-5,6,7,8-tetrahydropterin synthase [Endomicrobiia bacterium]|uniref:6-carboxy-5,6,7,8-tetrahydropterin synthase n=1 Tax=Endomicrobium trichonymphae TaxID=1408204 RepID=B1GYR9_ENDTX|nr:6-carboxytetrahydropterin synthase QueD [Candidatus Endomicrobium trichonymphae]GHT05058.1 6-carboxy-5,6,7,8-tetrahydropterin synthase [Endomicrobiia bacterium]BAG14162.1 6-pyruvoyltetrahydropterin/6-carboxytetrahydropterin synthase [Candidatus Endomicrobium trichonymphae]BAV59220.1 putative 6-pyruvoyl tetrahydrobiopterin synthase [Candidatus Endomicrobium trichonymphae]GHT07972.1 6-carboxy-5,6,7,8-tetrahydropterin synthase [Endomicrobiia bacterium]GHT14273.1 6-carboxy-5,6,7,8-tetrahydropte
MKYKLSVTRSFSSAHCLREYKGRCENLHGHNWKIRAAFYGTELDDTGVLIDFMDIKMHLNKVINYLDHKFLNEIVPFDRVNPTAENIAAFILGRLKDIETKNAKVCEVEIWESESSSAVVCI